MPFLLAGNFCPLCDKCYDDDDYESKMMQCGKCDRWVHSKCEDLSGEAALPLLHSRGAALGACPKTELLLAAGNPFSWVEKELPKSP